MNRYRVTIYLKPIIKILEIDDNLEEDEIEQEIDYQVYDKYEEEILDEAEIDYWED